MYLSCFYTKILHYRPYKRANRHLDEKNREVLMQKFTDLFALWSDMRIPGMWLDTLR